MRPLGVGACAHPRLAHAPTVLDQGGATNKLREEMNGRQAHRAGTFVLSLLMVAIGIALVVQAVGEQGGVSTTRLLLGALFAAGGIGRGYVEVRRGRGR